MLLMLRQESFKTAAIFLFRFCQSLESEELRLSPESCMLLMLLKKGLMLRQESFQTAAIFLFPQSLEAEEFSLSPK